MLNIAKKVLQWPRGVVPLLKRALLAPPLQVDPEIAWPEEICVSVREDVRTRAIETAREIAEEAELEIVERKRSVDSIGLRVYSQTSGLAWWVDIYPDHITGWRGARFDLMVINHIKFKFERYPVTEHRMNHSSYLTIEFVK